VDNLLFEIGDKIGVDAATPLSVMYTLVASKLVGQQISDFYENLRDARNLISHAQTVPDEREALEYVRQADFLLASLSVLKGKIESGEITLQNKAP
jgi:ABC-type transporter lipoprotein component MlaA